MSVRPYNPSVRVGNWNEDIQLEEDTLKDFLERKERGELLIQKSAALTDTAFSRINLTVSRDGKIHFGDVIMIVNPEPRDKSRPATVLSLNGDSVTASTNVTPANRTAFRIVSIDGTPEGNSLKYEQLFSLASVQMNAFLCSDRATFSKNFAKKSRHNAVTVGNPNPKLAEWKVKAYDPQFRMEMEYSDVMANTPLILTHRTTNENLCVERNFLIRTPFGKEYEVSTYTKLDSHRAEDDVNHWILQCSVPGDPIMPVSENQ